MELLLLSLPRMLTNIKDWLYTETKALFELKPDERLWHMPLLAALCMALPLLAGLYAGHLSFSILSCIGALVILYLPATPMRNRMLVMALSSLGFVLSYAVGLNFSFNIIPKIIALSAFTFFVHGLCLWFNFKTPGSIFFILLASVAAYSPYQADTILIKTGFIALGTLLACTVALLYSWYAISQLPAPVIAEEAPATNADKLFEAAIIAACVAVSLLLAYYLKLERPYWVPVSCVAVMKGVDLNHVWQRSFQRVMGTLTGLALAWLLLKIEATPLMVCLTIPVLQFLAEWLVGRNYALALIFITPMAMLLAEVGGIQTMQADELITTRLIDIVLGSAVGAVGGWFLYNQKLRSHAAQQFERLNFSDRGGA